MHALTKLAWIEIKLFLREPAAAFFTLVFPLMMLFLFGGMYGNEPSTMFNGYGSVDVSVPSYAAMIIATSGLMGLTINLSTQRERGILRRLRATPLTPRQILLANVAVTFIATALGVLLLIIAAKLVFDLRFGGNALSVFAAFAFSCASFFTLGFILAGLMPTARTAQAIAMVIFYPMIFLSGATIPREVLPQALQPYIDFLPLSHVVSLLRGLWMGGSWGQHVSEMIVLFIMLIVGVAVSAKTFRWE